MRRKGMGIDIPDDDHRCGRLPHHIGPRITGPKYFTAATTGDKGRSVSFRSPRDYVEKTNLGMR